MLDAGTSAVARIDWPSVLVTAVVMLATLPGRTLAPAVLVLGFAAVRVGFPLLPAVPAQPRMA